MVIFCLIFSADYFETFFFNLYTPMKKGAVSPGFGLERRRYFYLIGSIRVPQITLLRGLAEEAGRFDSRPSLGRIFFIIFSLTGMRGLSNLQRSLRFFIFRAHPQLF